MSILEAIGQSVISGKIKDIEFQVNDALAQGITPLEVIQKGLAVGMEEVGRLFKADQYYLPDVLLSAKTMGLAVAILEPLLLGDNAVKPIGKVVIGTVKGDVHDIGKNIVIMMLKGAGFAVVDLGVNIPVEKFIEAYHSEKPDVIGLSALLSTTLPQQQKTIEAFEEAGLRSQVKIIVGGAPVTEPYAKRIRADGMATDAVNAVEVIKGWVLEKQRVEAL